MASLRQHFDGPPEHSHCNRCGGRRKHNILGEVKTSWSDQVTEHNSIDGTDNYYVLECAGCGEVHFRHDSWFSEDTDAAGDPVGRVKYFPPIYSRRKPAWFEDSLENPFFLNDTDPVGRLLSEIYPALQNGMPMLAAMGMRALLENLMISQVGDNGTFHDNLEAFRAAGWIGEKDRDLLRDRLLEIGHAAMHRGYRPPADDLDTMMDVIEHLVEAIYVRPLKVERLDANIPGRRPRNNQR